MEMGRAHYEIDRREMDKKITEWCPINKTRNRGRPARRWRDDGKLTVGIEWSRIARDTDAWSHLGEAYALGGLVPS